MSDRLPLVERCEHEDFRGFTGPEMQAHAEARGHHVFYAVP